MSLDFFFIFRMVTSKKVALSPRNLKPDQLGGVIFGCTDSTINECLAKQLFGGSFYSTFILRNEDAILKYQTSHSA